MKKLLKDTLYFGIDDLEFIIKKENILFYEKIVQELDEDNTVSGYLELSGIEFHYIKTKPKGYDFGFKFDFAYDGKVIDAFSINIANNTITTLDKNSLVVYSQLLSLENIGNLDFDIYSFLMENFNLEYSNYKRFDFCLDLPYTKSEIIPYFKKFKSKIGLQKDGYYETYYTREIRSDKNRLMVTRIYDKKLDSFRKRKGFLYSHLENDHVTRIEVEVRIDYAKTVAHSLQEMLCDIKIQKNIFRNFLNKDLKEEFQLKATDLDKILFQKSRYDLGENFQKIGYIPQNYMAQANGYAKNILEQTGWQGFTQYIIGHSPDDSEENLGLNGDKNQKIERKPEFILDELVGYMKNILGYPQSKINKVLRTHLSTPILKPKK